jgi:hypothetical protein
MVNSTARLTFLRLIGEHEGEWGWYQFERAFPPGWFADESPDTTAMDILGQLQRDGLVATTPGDSRGKCRLTERGMDALREGAIGSASA